jgi:hypothetical protein
VLVGLLLPAAAPHRLKALGEGAHQLAGGGREVVDDAVDEQEAPRRRVGGIEPEERDDAVDV